MNAMLDKIENGEVILGLCNMYPAAGIIESMFKGWDFAWIDCQHGQHSYESMLHACMAARGQGVSTMIRVPGHDHSWLGRVADLSPQAIMIPMVNNKAEAEHVAAGLRFAPAGVRSYGGRRVIDLHGREYYHEQRIAVIAQIETLEGVANIDDIMNTEGIDGVFFGPDDMRVQLKLPINTPIEENEQLQAACRDVAAAARRSGKFCGAAAGSPEALRVMAGLGFQLLACGSDVGFIRVAATKHLENLKEALPSNTPSEQPAAAFY